MLEGEVNVFEAEQGLAQLEVPRTAHRQKLRESLYNSQNNGLPKGHQRFSMA